MCLGLGLGWVNLMSGYLNRAEDVMVIALKLLAHIPDFVIYHYINLLYGTILVRRMDSY